MSVNISMNDEINELLDLDEKKEFAVYMGVVGKKR